MHNYIGRVILESIIQSFFLHQYTDIPNLTEENSHYGGGSFDNTASLQANSIFPISFIVIY